VLGEQIGNPKRVGNCCVEGARLRAGLATRTLAPESRAKLEELDLHFHDLRHEAGWPIHHVKEMLGHANLSQTSTYLNAGPMGLQDSMQRFDPSRCNPVATDAKQEPPLDCNEEPQETPKSLIN